MFKGIIDTTLRDGQQSPLMFDSKKYRFSVEEKKKLVAGLVNLGITHIEFFSPVVSDIEYRDFLEIKQHIASITNKKIMLLAHCRCSTKDIEKAIEAGFDGLHLYINGTQKAHAYGYNKKKQEVLDQAVDTISAVRNAFPKLYLRFSIEDAFRTTRRDLYSFFDPLHAYVNTIGIPDTVGVATPELVSVIIADIKKRYKNVDVECHFHNDRGYALINTMTAIQAGAEYVDGSIWGLAERSGIASITGILLNLHHTNKRLSNRYNLDLSYPLNVLMGSILKMQVPYNEPVSVTNRTHIAGVHHKAVLNHKKIYEAHSLEHFGVTKNQLLLGPLSGWNLIFYFLREVGNYELTIEQAKKITHDFKDQTLKIGKRFKPEILLFELAEKYALVKTAVPLDYELKRIENLN